MEVIRRVSRARGFAVPAKDRFAHEVGLLGALYVGSPETVARKIAANLTTLGASRFDLKYGIGALRHEALMTNIELYGTQVILRVKELLPASEDGSPRCAPTSSGEFRRRNNHRFLRLRR